MKKKSPGDTYTFSHVPQEMRDCNDEEDWIPWVALAITIILIGGALGAAYLIGKKYGIV